MSRYYKCDLCGTPYAPTYYKHTTAYIKTGDRVFDGRTSDNLIRDICPGCMNKIRDFMNSLKPKEEADERV